MNPGFRVGSASFSTISGPVTVVHLTPLNVTDPQIVLFGEMPQGMSKALCAEPDSVLLSSREFLSALNELGSREQPILFALEADMPIDLQVVHRYPQQAAALLKGQQDKARGDLGKFVASGRNQRSWMVDLVAPCMLEQKHGLQPWFRDLCPFTNLRFVLSDFRALYSSPKTQAKYFWEMLVLMAFNVLALEKPDVDSLLEQVRLAASRFNLSVESLLDDVQDAITALVVEPERVMQVLLPAGSKGDHSLLKSKLTKLTQNQLDSLLFREWFLAARPANMVAELRKAIVDVFAFVKLRTTKLGWVSTSIPKFLQWRAESVFPALRQNVKAHFDKIQSMYMDVYFLWRLTARFSRSKIVVGYFSVAHVGNLRNYFVNLKRSHSVQFDLPLSSRGGEVARCLRSAGGPSLNVQR